MKKDSGELGRLLASVADFATGKPPKAQKDYAVPPKKPTPLDIPAPNFLDPKKIKKG